MTPAARPPPDRAIHQARECLVHDPTAPSRARTLVRETLREWRLVELIDDAELVVSELVTNALRHGLPPIVLELRQGSATLRIDVSDGRPSTTHHEIHVVSQDDDESGRGKGIVEAVSDRSGTDNTVAIGKSIYASWDVTPTAD
jgi:anti-sigma regulatory factor (Ser/Thr protein kinase)